MSFLVPFRRLIAARFGAQSQPEQQELRPGLAVRVGGLIWQIRDDQSLTIGRRTGEPELADRFVSRRHLGIRFEGGWVVEDLGSRNGTFFADQRVAEMRIGARCTLRLGSPTTGPEVHLEPMNAADFVGVGATSFRRRRPTVLDLRDTAMVPHTVPRPSNTLHD